MNKMKYLIHLFLSLWSIVGYVHAFEVRDVDILSQEANKSIKLMLITTGVPTSFPEVEKNKKFIEVILKNTKISKNVLSKISEKMKTQGLKQDIKSLKNSLYLKIFHDNVDLENVKVQIKKNNLILSMPSDFLFLDPSKNQQKDISDLAVQSDMKQLSFLETTVKKNNENKSETVETKNKSEEFFNQRPSVLSDLGPKVLGFLTLLLLGFYSIFKLIKKGFFKKSHLNFLQHSSDIEIISSKHIAPKKTLHVVKVFDQMILIGATENSLNKIADIKDNVSALKKHESSFMGDNFDDSMNTASKLDHYQMREKVDINQSKSLIGDKIDGLSQKTSSLTSAIKKKAQGRKQVNI